MKAKNYNSKVLGKVLEQLETQGISLGISYFLNNFEIIFDKNSEKIISVNSREFDFKLLTPVLKQFN